MLSARSAMSDTVEAGVQYFTLDGSEWWKELSVEVLEYTLKSTGIRILSIVPHAGEVERLSFNLGHIQGVRRCNLLVPHTQTLGSL